MSKRNQKDVQKLIDGIDVTNQSQIDELKALHPGAGVGPYVQEKLSAMISSGEISTVAETPFRYLRLWPVASRT
ncbi:hypothetical protein [Marinimicrobium sp. ABcell2]|uniref:hypothetical protein n=1 Tax=Marinimicrobium sp. ABcell2 TaxID=3069751 RepID=UPI0027B11170|nr:hypothetical protein [Marinimicrobium sp. ABcell2]MDQ2078523.1 hypothetical protein [Marinimicrobium sp. ABcell2]